MKRGSLILSLLVLTGFLSVKAKSMDESALRADAQKVFKEKVGPFVKKYCTRCHGSRPKAGINLQSALNNPSGASAALHWKKAMVNVKVHDMPPEDASKIPSDEERRQFIEWIGKIKYLVPRDPGPFVIRRLTKKEYANTLRDFYGVDSSIADSLPKEVEGEGFLNSISPLQSELFLGIANKVIAQVVSPEDKAPTAVQKRLFGETPTEGSDLRKAARGVASSLARNAYRRPTTEAELDVLADVYDLARDNDLNHSAALGLMLKAVLVSPQFLFITPAGEPESKEAIVPAGRPPVGLAPVVPAVVGTARRGTGRIGRQERTAQARGTAGASESTVEGHPVAGVVRWVRRAVAAGQRIGRTSVRPENISRNDAGPTDGDDGRSPPIF